MGCTVPACDGTYYSKGYCRTHYVRWRRHGDPLHVGKPGPPRHTCDIDGCDAPCAANGLCDKHRKRLERWGSPLDTRRIIGDTEARWWSHVDRRGDDECWPWAGTVNQDGYGRFGEGQKVVVAHVWGYRRFVGPVPDGMQLDHVKDNGCTMRSCVNFLRHLEPVTSRENVLRGERTKLSDDQVSRLLDRARNGEHFADLAREAGVHKGTLIKRFGMLAIEEHTLEASR